MPSVRAVGGLGASLAAEDLVTIAVLLGPAG